MADSPDDDAVHNSMTGPVHGPAIQAGHIHRDLVVHHHGQRPDETRELAALVVRAERPVLNQLLGDQAASPVADTLFTQLSMELVSWRTDGGGENGSLREIASYYRGLKCGRLVVTGEAGAGKTVLLLQLLLDLLEGDAPRRVPVRLSLPTFDPGPGVALADLRHVETAALAARLESWIAAQLRTSFGFSKRYARYLVRSGYVLPVLDGLDEMDPDDAEPATADAVVRALNLRPDPVVLACRSSRYRQLSEPMEDATVVAVQPLNPKAVAEYLTARSPYATSQWQPVLDRLRRPQRDDALVSALRSPLRLYLAATAYRTRNPAELLTLTTHEEIDQHLLDRFVLAVTAASPRYRTEDAHRWLVSLARVMDDNARRGRSGSDLAVTDVWRVAGRLQPRLLGALPLVLVAISGPLLAYLKSGEIVTPLLLAGALTVIVVPGVSFKQQILCPSIRVLRSWRRLELMPFHLVLFGGGGVPFFSSIYYSAGLGASPAVTATVLVGSGVFILRQLPEVVSRPGMLVHRALRSELVAVTIAVIATGVAVTTIGVHDALLAAGFLGSLTLTLVLVLSPWGTYFAAILLAASRGALPWRPARFLDWALDVGLLRMSGGALQFRHREFQRHLLR